MMAVGIDEVITGARHRMSAAVTDMHTASRSLAWLRGRKVTFVDIRGYLMDGTVKDISLSTDGTVQVIFDTNVGSLYVSGMKVYD